MESTKKCTESTKYNFNCKKENPVVFCMKKSFINLAAYKRGSFDIGSGTIKFLVGHFDANNQLVSVEHGHETNILFGADWLHSKDGNLSSDIQNKGLDILKNYQSIALESGVALNASYAIATEVFRKSKNGADYLKRIENELGIRNSVISQSAEAELGYLTAIGHVGMQYLSQSFPMDHVIVWDSGSASFQMTTVYKENAADAVADKPMYTAYMAPFGTSVVSKLMKSWLYASSMSEDLDFASIELNPVSMKQADTCISKLCEILPNEVPDWLRPLSGPHTCNRNSFEVNSTVDLNWNVEYPLSVLCIGGSSCIFQTAFSILSYHGELRPCVGYQVITRDDVYRCIKHCSDKKSEELRKYITYRPTDGAGNIVPKLVLLYSVMQHVNLSYIHVVHTVGSCIGVLNSHQFWNA